jgi:hypothetical protein
MVPICIIPINASEHHKMNELKKLTIRISFPAKQDRAPENKNRYHYHWRRITGTSFATMLVIASLFSAQAYYLTQDQINSESVTDKSIAFGAPTSLKKEAVQAASQKNILRRHRHFRQ